MKKYYSMSVEGKEADIYIFGDIVAPEWKWYDSDTSGYSLAQDVKDLDVDVINVHINSYGGHVSEGLAIYNTLKQHKAKIKTYCDGFACSAASVVFMAGDERIMAHASLLMIHNAWNMAVGNAEELRKAADDLETISETAANVYKTIVSISEDELKKLLDEEAWITPQDALEKGFATKVEDYSTTTKASANVRHAVFQRIANNFYYQSKVLEPNFDKILYLLGKLEGMVENLVQQSDTALKGDDANEVGKGEGEDQTTEESEESSINNDEENSEQPPKENKPLKLLNALFGGKEG